MAILAIRRKERRTTKRTCAGVSKSAETSKNCHNPCTTCRVFIKLIRSTPTAPTVAASMR
jgi:hypothetical protein